MEYVIDLVQTEKDLGEVVQLDRLLDLDMSGLLPHFFNPADITRNYDGYLDGARGFALVARAGGMVIGMARCVIGSVAMLESLVVRSDFRGQGIGTALFNAAREMAKSRGQSIMMLNVLKGNDGARKLYEREGFQEFRSTMVAEL